MARNEPLPERIPTREDFDQLKKELIIKMMNLAKEMAGDAEQGFRHREPPWSGGRPLKAAFEIIDIMLKELPPSSY